MHEMTPDSAETRALLERLREGDRAAIDRLLSRHRDELHEFVSRNLDPRIRTRVDPSDVVQEAQIKAMGRLDDYLERPPMPFRLWLRKQAYDRMLNLRRDHLTRGRRSVGREERWPDRSSLLLAKPLLDAAPSPSQRLAAHELAERLGRAVEGLPDPDREVLLLRHAEGLPFAEIGCLLDIDEAAARKRFGRALIRLQKAMIDVGLLESRR